MKTILFLFPHFLLPGGAANVVLRFARQLQSLGYPTAILCAGVHPHIYQDYPDLRFDVVKVPYSSSLKYWAFFLFWQRKINRAIAKYEDCILFPHVLPSNWWAWLFKRCHPGQKVVWYANEPSAFIHIPKWIQTIPNPWVRMGARICNPLLKWIDIVLEKEANIVICDSQFSATEYERVYRKKPDAIICPPIVLSAKPANEKKQYLFTASRLTQFKRVDLLIHAFGKIRHEFPEYQLWIAGEGEEKANLELLVAKQQLQSQIRFLGKISDATLAECYSQARFTVLCSCNEPFGLVPVESMGYGTPVVAHRSGGPLETVLEQKTGFFFQEDHELATILTKALKLQPAEYYQMQQESLEQAKKYQIEAATQHLITLFG